MTRIGLPADVLAERIADLKQKIYEAATGAALPGFQGPGYTERAKPRKSRTP
jgi:hypothetical protein